MAEMFSCFNEVIENAKLIEVHPDRYINGKREDPDLKQMYVLIAAFENEEGIVPVKLSVKDFYTKNNKLYVSIVMPTIEKANILKTETQEVPTASPLALSSYKLADLLTIVKNDEKSESLGQNH